MSIAINGICVEPLDEGNRVEFISGDPMLFKNIVEYFKDLKVKTIFVRCQKDNITFYAYNAAQSLSTIIRYPGASAVRYYCKEDDVFEITASDILYVAGFIDKNYIKVCFVRKIDDPTFLNFVLYMDELRNEKHLSINTFSTEVAKHQETLTKLEETYSDANVEKMFSLEFSIKCSIIKKDISDSVKSAKSSAVMKINKIAGHPLTISFDNSDKTIACDSIYRLDDLIALRSTLDDGESSGSIVPVSCVKNFASSGICDTMKFIMKGNEEMLLSNASNMSNIKVLTIVQPI